MRHAVTAILVSYNSQSVIGQALASLALEPAIDSILVVDNASSDHTREMIKRDFPKVMLIENAENIGFGPANNIALEKVTTPYALLVNPDAVMNTRAVEALLAAAARYADAAILAPALYDAGGKLHRSYKPNVFEREKNQAWLRGEEASGDLCAGFLSGAVMLLNMELMKKVGFFDPNIFLYSEDDDLCLRVRQAGYGLVYVPEARVTHLQGASTGAPNPASEFFKQKHMAWSRLYLEEKYQGRLAAELLAGRLHKMYRLKARLYALRFNKMRTALYRGRLAGIEEFLEKEAKAAA